MRFPFYPFLVAVYPVVRLYSINQDLVVPVVFLRPLFVAVLLAAVLLGLSRLFLKDWSRAAIFSSLCLAIFFFFQPMCNFVHNWIRIRFALAILGMIVVSLIFILRRAGEHNVRQVGKVIAVFAVGLLIVPSVTALSSIVSSCINDAGYKQWAAVLDLEGKKAQRWKGVPEKSAPDIYYIILDMYARDDVLKKDFNFDNSRFLKSLSAKGFFVARHSQSNYHKTLWSLASSLNMDYLPALGRDCVEDDALLVHKIERNKVSSALKHIGYKYIFMRSGWHVTGRSYYANKNLYRIYDLNEFERVLLDQTMLGGYINDLMRDQVLWQFECLERVNRIKGPKFVFAHIVCPHEPYLFDDRGYEPSIGENGAKDAGDNNARLYVKQLEYVNKRVSKIVDTIITGSDRPPIIILQADHGAYRPDYAREWNSAKATGLTDKYIQNVFSDRVRIFNAYYLPGAKPELIYDGISPVNSFRIVFNYYFGADYKLLKDISYVPRSGQSATQQSAKHLRAY